MLCRIDHSIVDPPVHTPIDLLQRQVGELTLALEKEVELRKSERISRINLQKRMRDEKIMDSLDNGFSYRPIGVVRSPFGKRCGTPRQPILCPAAKGRICFDKKIIQAEHFQELKDFSHIWVWSLRLRCILVVNIIFLDRLCGLFTVIRMGIL